MDAHQPPPTPPDAEDSPITDQDMAARREWARLAMGEEIEFEWIHHRDGCPWGHGGRCMCECVAVFVSATKLAAIEAGLFGTMVRRH